jgi:transcriptional regulator with XRE-family HTH domain
MEPIALEVGRALRRARAARGLTLRDLAPLSGGRFKATSVAGYERGERSISLERFCGLCDLYGVTPEGLLAKILRAVEGRAESLIDLTALEALGTSEAALISGFIDRIRSLRGTPEGNTVALRVDDLQVLATAAGKRPDELLEILAPAKPPGGR